MTAITKEQVDAAIKGLVHLALLTFSGYPAALNFPPHDKTIRACISRLEGEIDCLTNEDRHVWKEIETAPRGKKVLIANGVTVNVRFVTGSGAINGPIGATDSVVEADGKEK